MSTPTTSTDPPQEINKSETFYYERELDGCVVFQVDYVLYRIPRLYFQRDSEIFRSMFTLPQSPSTSVEGIDDHNPIRLQGVTTEQFDSFLSVLYPSDIFQAHIKTISEWASILHLATMWDFASVRKLAIKRLEEMGSAVDKIVLARSCNVKEWFIPSYTTLCVGSDPLTLDDGRRLGVDDVIHIYKIRHKKLTSRMLLSVIQSEFGLSEI